jgi:hypothetical protein
VPVSGNLILHIFQVNRLYIYTNPPACCVMECVHLLLYWGRTFIAASACVI